VSYRRVGEAEALFRTELKRLMDDGRQRFCDVGGGAKPVVSLADVQQRELNYVVFDASQEQLEKAPSGYQTFCGDALDSASVQALVREHGVFDVVLSRWAAEHMSDGRLFHAHVHQMLRPGGIALHFFPTLYSLPFLANRILSDDLSSFLLFRAFTGRKVKFPAHYSWCRGPTKRQIGRLEALDYSVERYTGFFGHSFYARVKPLHHGHQRLMDVLVAHPAPLLTSFALVVLERPT
jgi:SAM-dependent methyltransferase